MPSDSAVPPDQQIPLTCVQWSRDQPYSATLLSHKPLTGVASRKDVRHIEIDLGTSGLQYEPGDTLGIWIGNDPELVAEILQRCELDAQQPVEFNDKQLTLGEALLRHVELTQVHPGFIKHYAQCSNNAALQQLAANTPALRSYLENRQIVDVIKQYPAAVTAQQLLSCLRKLTPRQYSIASSPLLNPKRVDLTVNMVRYQQDDSTRIGAASGFLGWRVHEGDKVPVFVVANPNFRLPENPDTAIIMIGPGTGIAPFRAFLQQRSASAAKGGNWLFFGNPQRSADFLYEQELDAFQASGVLTRLDLAFSRDQAEKLYVQQRMQENAAELFAWINTGAYLYVCGDAKRMAEDVQRTLLDIIATHGNMDAAAARQYLVKLRQDKRYQRDVY